MPQALLLPSATSDLAEPLDYIAYGNPANADRLVYRIRSTCSTTSENPRIGRSREELAPELRSFPFRDYAIFYRPIDDGVEIVRVLHGTFYIPSRGPNARPAGAPLEHYGPLQSQEAVKYTSAILEFVRLQMARREGSG